MTDGSALGPSVLARPERDLLRALTSIMLAITIHTPVVLLTLTGAHPGNSTWWSAAARLPPVEGDRAGDLGARSRGFLLTLTSTH